MSRPGIHYVETQSVVQLMSGQFHLQKKKLIGVVRNILIFIQLMR